MELGVDMSIELKQERWRYPRFFTKNISDEIAAVDGEDARHISVVLRMCKGDIVVLCDGNGTDYLAELDSSTPENCVFRIREKSENQAEPSIRLRLFQAFPKGDKMDFIVQKAVECGASEIVPIFSKRCISRPDGKSLSRKLPRFQKIALEAAKQCGRGIVPTVGNAVELSKLETFLGEDSTKILFYECAEAPLSRVISEFKRDVDIIIGSEGGFEPSEADFLAGLGFIPVSLGKRILRCETAPIAAISVLMNLTGNM